MKYSSWLVYVALSAALTSVFPARAAEKPARSDWDLIKAARDRHAKETAGSAQSDRERIKAQRSKLDREFERDTTRPWHGKDWGHWGHGRLLPGPNEPGK